jgi:hypothetical protein
MSPRQCLRTITVSLDQMEPLVLLKVLERCAWSLQLQTLQCLMGCARIALLPLPGVRVLGLKYL